MPQSLQNFPHHLYVVGLTGGIGSGKTTVSQQFETLGIEVVDADLIAKQVVEPGQPCLESLVKALGPAILKPDQSLNRAALRSQMFSDPSIKTQVEAIMHPAIRTALLQGLQAAQSPYVILSAPLLFENKLEAYCHTTLVVDLPIELQISRTTQRDKVSQAEVEKIIEAQIPRSQRLAKADWVLDNSLPKEALAENVAYFHQKFLKEATAHQAAHGKK